MARIGFSQRAHDRLPLCLDTRAGGEWRWRSAFVPYTDNHGNFDAFWTTFMALCLAGALAASIYVISVLEILKLRRVRWRQLVGLRGPAAPPDEAEVDVAVQHELDTGTFQAVDPTTGEMAAIDPDTGEIEAVSDPNR